MSADWDDFLAAWTRGAWQARLCRECGAASAIPRPSCPRCGARALDVVTAAGEGVVETWTRIHHRFYPRAAGAPPFCVAAVALDDFPLDRFVAPIVEDPDVPVRRGLRVRLGVLRGDDGVRRPAFYVSEG